MSAALNENADLRARITALQDKLSHIMRERSGAEADELKEIAARADQALAIHGERAGPPGMGETPTQFRARLAEVVAKHSPKFRQQSLRYLTGPALDAVEQQVYADAREAAYGAANKKQGTLISEQTRDESGRLVTKFYGDPLCWMSAFMNQGVSGRFLRGAK